MIIRNSTKEVKHPNTVLEKFFQTLPEKTLHTNNLSHGLNLFPKDYAKHSSYIQLNQLYRHYIPLDLDRPDALQAFRKAGIPQPTIMTINRSNGHAHYLYRLNKPIIFTENGRTHPQEYFREICESLEFQLDADPHYVGLITKNPFSPVWHTETDNVSFELSDFKEYILNRLPKQFRKQKQIAKLIHNATGRNCTLFDTIRFFAYNQVKFCNSQAELMAKVLELAADVNTKFSEPLPNRELLDTSKSVSKWTFSRKEQFLERTYKNRGIMALSETDLTLQEKQRIGAEYTAQIKANATKEKIQTAIGELVATGKRATQKEIAGITGLSERTIRYCINNK
jgi:hypothetical protein